jgi:hypothetical protein
MTLCDLQIVAMILGSEMAPWEHPMTAAAMLRPLGHFKGPVLAMLERDPRNRPSMLQFKQACQRVLAQSMHA